MNRHVKAYTKKILLDFMDFVVAFDGQIDKKHFCSIALSKLCEDCGEWKALTRKDIEKIVECYIEELDKDTEKTAN